MQNCKGSDALDLTIFVPCLNEAENIISILNDIKEIISDQHFKSEVIVVDDRSEDETFQLAEKWAQENQHILSVRVVRRELARRGYGAVVRHGIAHGNGRYCIFVSADAVDPIHLIPRLYAEMEQGAILAQCSRYLAKGDDSTIPFKYKFFQFFFRIGVRIVICNPPL